MAAAFPDTPEYRADLASTHAHLGLLLGGGNTPDDAAAQYRAAIDLCERLV